MKRSRTNDIDFIEESGAWYVVHNELTYYVYADDSFKQVATNSIEYNYDFIEFENSLHLKADNVKYNKCNYYTIQEMV
jgi:hypothetical protein